MKCKIIGQIFIVVLLVTLIVPFGAVSAQDDEQVTLTFYSHRFSEVPYGDILRGQVAEYEELNPNIKVEFVTAPWSETPAKVTAMVLGGAPPDAIFTGRAQGQYIAQGLLMNLEPFIAEAGGDEFKARFPATAEAAVIDPDSGNWHALPAETQFWTLVVNADRASEAELTLPEDGVWSWDEFLEAAEALNDPDNGKYAFVNYGYADPSGQGIVVGQWMLANGGTYWGFNDDCTEVNLLTPENIEAIEHYTSLGIEGFQPPGYVERGGGDHYRLLSSVAAMAVTHPGGVANASTLAEGKISGFIPLYLPGDDPKVSLFTEAWGIAEGAEHPEEAWDFINWLNSDEKALERMELQGSLPAAISALDAVKEINPSMSFWVELVGSSQAACYEYLPNKAEIMQAATDGLTRIYLGEDVEVVLEDVETQLRDLLEN